MSYFMFPIIMIYLGFFAIQLPKLTKERRFKELIAASLLLLVTVSYGIGYAMDWKRLPNPTTLISAARPVSQAFERFFTISH